MGFCRGSFPARRTRRCAFVLLRFLLGGMLYGNNLRVTNRLLSTTRDNHQTATIGTEVSYGALPNGKIAGGIIAAAIKDAFLLPGFTFYQVTSTLRAESARFLHKRASIAALRESRAGDKTAKATGADNEPAPAFGTKLLRLLDRLLYAIHLGFGLLHADFEIAIEAVEKFCP